MIITKKYTVSILCITYNHEKYIEQAVESFFDQKTSFHVEMIIADDASSDRNQEVIKALKATKPDIISILRQKNIGPQANWLDAFKKCTGKYIALCEGDDYWTDPYKLQKQVDFLERNSDFSICGHKTKMLFENDPMNGEIEGADEGNYSIEDLTRKNFIPTSSVLFIKEYIKVLPGWFFNLPVGDWPLFLLLAQHGKIQMLGDVMSVHRIHSGGIWTADTVNKTYINQHETLLKTFDIIKDKFNSSVNKQLLNNYNNELFHLATIYYKSKNYHKLREIVAELSRIEDINGSGSGYFFNTLINDKKHTESQIESLNNIITSYKNSKSFRIGNRIVNLLRLGR